MFTDLELLVLLRLQAKTEAAYARNVVSYNALLSPEANTSEMVREWLIKCGVPTQEGLAHKTVERKKLQASALQRGVISREFGDMLNSHLDVGQCAASSDQCEFLHAA